jgi:hypothetical protein
MRKFMSPGPNPVSMRMRASNGEGGDVVKREQVMALGRSGTVNTPDLTAARKTGLRLIQ